MWTDRVLRVRYHLQRRVRTGNGWRLFSAEDLRTGRPCLVYEVDLDCVAPRRHSLLTVLRTIRDPRFPNFTDMFTMGPRCYAVQEVVCGRTLADELRANPHTMGERAAAERAVQICDLATAIPDIDVVDPERLAVTSDGVRVTSYDLDQTESASAVCELLQSLCGDHASLRDIINGDTSIPALRDQLRHVAAGAQPAYACVA